MRARMDAASAVRDSAEWPMAASCCHAVQFYETDAHLVDLLTRYVGTALVGGDVALVIATKPHRDALARRLKANGLDVSVPRRQGRYIALDADATLARFFRNGAIDRERFSETLGGVLDDALRGGDGRRIAAFGEMVALLWARGKPDSAIQLEKLWNELAERYRFALCCAYPMKGFGNRHAAPFMSICAQHSHVFTAPRRLDLS